MEKKPEKQYERRDQETKKKEQSHVDTNFTQGQQWSWKDVLHKSAII